MADEGMPMQAQSSNKRRSALLIILAVFALLGVGGFAWWMHTSSYEETEDAYLTGRLHAVGARVSGTVMKVLVDDNQSVQVGQPMVLLDPTDFQVALRQAEHNLAVAQMQAKAAESNIPYTMRQASSQVEQAQGGIGVSQAALAQARSAVEEADAAVGGAIQNQRQQQAAYDKALADYQRYKGANPEAVSAQQVDAAEASLKIAEANLKAARDGLIQAQARKQQAQKGIQVNAQRIVQSQGVYQGARSQHLQVDVVKRQYDTAQAQVLAAKDAVAQAKLNLSYTRIAAPIAGRVGQRAVEVGQRVQVGQPIMSIVSPEVWVVANFKETQLQHMRPGQSVSIKVDAYPDHPFRGWVDSFAPASGAQFALLPPENATGNFTKIVQRVGVKIVFDAQSIRGYERLLVPGLSIIPKVHVRENPKGASHV